ncbi:hypothetical protein AB6D11_06230 [Vibrio splendidus]
MNHSPYHLPVALLLGTMTSTAMAAPELMLSAAHSNETARYSVGYSQSLSDLVYLGARYTDESHESDRFSSTESGGYVGLLTPLETTGVTLHAEVGYAVSTYTLDDAETDTSFLTTELGFSGLLMEDVGYRWHYRLDLGQDDVVEYVHELGVAVRYQVLDSVGVQLGAKQRKFDYQNDRTHNETFGEFGLVFSF